MSPRRSSTLIADVQGRRQPGAALAGELLRQRLGHGLTASSSPPSGRGPGPVPETEQEPRRGVVIRLVRMFAGFLIIGIGISGLVLPESGWLLIILGLSLLPFAWAERAIRLIRRKIPGVHEDGRIPVPRRGS